jgi:hypothetical protein
MKLSVILCTHNPRLEYLSRTLEALRSQTVPRADWELGLIDNPSAEPLASRIDLSWHPEGRHIRPEDLGLAPARLSGIAETKGDLLFGMESIPFGTGLCVRAKVAQAYAAKVSGSKIRRSLGRRGPSLMGGEDLDLAMTSYDFGMGVGLFGELIATHLVDKRRLSPKYLHQIFVGGTYSFYIVRYLHTGIAPRYRGTTGFFIDSLKRLVPDLSRSTVDTCRKGRAGSRRACGSRYSASQNRAANRDSAKVNGQRGGKYHVAARQSAYHE